MEPFSKSYYRRRRLRIRKHDEVLADKVMDLSNLAAAALIFSQLQEGHFDNFKMLVNVILVMLAYCFVWVHLSKFD